MRFLPVNLDAVLVELDDLPQTLALLAALQAAPIAGVEELVPAARTLLIRYRLAVLSRGDLQALVAARVGSSVAARPTTLIEIPVDYNGEDIDEVALMLGISRDELIRRHTGSDYTVAFTGFAPGFAYLSGGHASLNVPRRTTPRTRIPAGAVGLAGQFSGVYPQASPGGWQIIGVTAAPMWDLAREVPALLLPGFRVRFVDAGPQECVEQVPAARPHALGDGPRLDVLATGLQALLQDLGRHGHAGQGVSASGAMDRAALRAANRLVGNPSDAACIEAVHGGLSLRCHGDTVLAVTGTDSVIELTTVNGARSVWPSHQPLALADGDRLTLAAPTAGLRSYVAVRGGFTVQPVLGSCSTDTLANLGPPPIAVGDVIGIHTFTRGGIVGIAEDAPPELPTAAKDVILDVVMGPRTDWFTLEAVALLASQPWRVTPQSNRVGLRLLGAEPLTRSNPAELASEGTVLGAIQVPPSGQPVLFTADHPLTGGYPVIAAVAPHHLDRVGQIPVGAHIRFNPIREFDPS
jgi:KipI family sensor histidine kinase inhibitor